MQRTICTFDIDANTKDEELLNGNHKYTCTAVIDTVERSASHQYFVGHDPSILETKVLDWLLITEYPKDPMLLITPEHVLAPGHYYFIALGDIVEVINYDDEPTLGQGTQED